MIRRKFPWVKKSLIAVPLINNDDGNTAADGEKANHKTRQPPKVDLVVVAKIVLVFFADLLLRFSEQGHRRSVVKESHKGMPRRKKEEKKRERHVHEEPGMKPALQADL